MKINQLLLLFVFCFCTISKVEAQTVINSLSELKDRLDDSNGNFKMTPGTYYFNSTNCGTGKLFPNSAILLFTGSNSTFDFTGVKFEFDTEVYAAYSSWTVEFWPTGNDNVYLNLTMEDIGNKPNTQGGEAIHFDGSDNRIEGFHITVRGSSPYGYGDIFGKGGGSVIGHKKHAGILVRGDRNHVKNVTLIMRAYGHGIFMQGAVDALIEGCYVEGELRTISEVLEEEGTGSPADNVDFLTVWGYNLKDLQHNYSFSLQEDGIRCYPNGWNYEGTLERNTTGTQIINCTVVKMRSGVTIGLDRSQKRVENCKVLACETGFWVGENSTVINCSGDASVGPLVSEDIARSNSTFDLTLLDNYVPKLGNNPYFFFAGSGHKLTLNDGTSYFDENITLQVGGTRVGHRWLAGTVTEPIVRAASGVTFTNNTKYPISLESNTTNSTIVSCGLVTNNGTGNNITLSSSCTYTRVCNNTIENLEAECYDAMSGIQSEAKGTNNERNIGYVHNNDWISFNALDLTGVTSVNVMAATNKTGTTIEVRQGSATGTLLATIPLTVTANFTTYQVSSVNLSKTVSGASTIYFVFKGGAGYLFNLDKISFGVDSCSKSSYNPLLPISAELFCASSGVKVYDRTNLNQTVGDINNTDYLRFSNVDFGFVGSYNAIQILASSATTAGDIEVRSGSTTGTLLTTVHVTNTGSWDTYKTFSSFTASEITGVHDIYLVFKGSSGFLMNVDSFKFRNDKCGGVTYNPYAEIDALNYCEMSGVVPINSSYLGGIQDGDWIRYGSVLFKTTGPATVTLKLAGLATTEGYVNVMLDNPKTGTVIATATVPKTGGWEKWQEVTVPINQSVTGTREVYIVFGNTSYNIDWFKFTENQSTLSTATNERKNQILVTPNPVENEFQIIGYAGAQFYLYTITGEKLLEDTITNGQFTVNINNHPTGIYLLKVVDNTGSYSSKLIKK